MIDLKDLKIILSTFLSLQMKRLSVKENQRFAQLYNVVIDP